MFLLKRRVQRRGCSLDHTIPSLKTYQLLTMHGFLRILPAFTAACLACGDGGTIPNAPEPPDPPPPRLAAAAVTTINDPNSQSSELIWLDTTLTEISSRLAFAGTIVGAALSANREVLALGIVAPGGRRELVVVDPNTRIRKTTLALGDIRSPTDPTVQLTSSERIAISHDGRIVYFAHATRNGRVVIAAVDLTVLQIVGTTGEFSSSSLMTMHGPTNGLPNGTLAIIGKPNEALQNAVYLFDAHTLVAYDSIAAGELAAFGGSAASQIVAPTRSQLYLAGPSFAAWYSLAERRALVVAPNSIFSGALSASSGGNWLTLTDAGVWPHSAGSGVLQVLDRQLGVVGSIDLSTPVGGAPNSPAATVMGAATGVGNGSNLLVRTGTIFHRNLMFPQTQPARIIVVDVATREVKAVIPLGGYGSGFVFAL